MGAEIILVIRNKYPEGKESYYPKGMNDWMKRLPKTRDVLHTERVVILCIWVHSDLAGHDTRVRSSITNESSDIAPATGGDEKLDSTCCSGVKINMLSFFAGKCQLSSSSSKKSLRIKYSPIMLLVNRADFLSSLSNLTVMVLLRIVIINRF